MQPSEEEMSRIINDVYWEAAKRLREDPQGTYQGPWSDKAAHAIMEKWDKGVVAQESGEAGVMHYTAKDAMLCVNAERIQVAVFGLPEEILAELDGQLVAVSVSKVAKGG